MPIREKYAARKFGALYTIYTVLFLYIYLLSEFEPWRPYRLYLKRWHRMMVCGYFKCVHVCMSHFLAITIYPLILVFEPLFLW